MLRIAMMGLLLGVGGCAVMSATECASADWYSVGYQDGAQGATMASANKRGDACHKHGWAMDHARYRDGRQAGLAEFCIPERGYDLGARGGSYAVVCRHHGEEPFLAAFHDGRAYHAVASAMGSAEAALDDAREELAWIDGELAGLAAKVPARALLDEDKPTSDEIAAHAAAVASHMARRGQLINEILPRLRADLDHARYVFDAFQAERAAAGSAERRPHG